MENEADTSSSPLKLSGKSTEADVRMRLRGFLIALAAVTICPAQTPQGLFSPEERDKVKAFWNEPNRYSVAPPKDHKTKGLWQVRLTIEGSTWLWNYNKGRKVFAPPTQDAPPASEEQKIWEKWIATKVAYDRWEAWRNAVQANSEAIGAELPVADSTIPATEPPQPGPIPAGLLDSAGDPPKFAEAIVPMEHTIDLGDTKLIYRDHIKPSNPRYAFLRFGQGVMSGGTPVKNLPPEKLEALFKIAEVDPAQANVMRAVSILEGGFDSVNTYDTGFVSVGFIQFACLQAGAGSLGSVLKQYKKDDKAGFDRDFRAFGLDVTDTGALAALDLDTFAELTGSEASKRIIDDKRLIAVFQRAGQKSDAFCAAQIKTAKNQYWPADDAISLSWDGMLISGKVSDVIHSEAGMATLFDRKVNTGKIDVLRQALERFAPEIKPKSLADFAAIERQIVMAIKYRKDYLLDPTLSQPGNGNPGISRFSRSATTNTSRSSSRKGRSQRRG